MYLNWRNQKKERGGKNLTNLRENGLRLEDVMDGEDIPRQELTVSSVSIRIFRTRLTLASVERNVTTGVKVPRPVLPPVLMEVTSIYGKGRKPSLTGQE
ncbi:hypothetical protein TNCT_655221 [Trichonephila clavata]|uniref:Uncharacterized protein n=1 Tax=Trichonephila clavata TaxID=2740835 RepID=A0A8X6FX52_TRICU|nr:hypothetical protein TNCT_655221 [Trichonephila clavata]